MNKVRSVVRRDTLMLKGSPLARKAGLFTEENPQPFFRKPDNAICGGPDFPEDKYYNFGRETGFRVLPYTMQDRYNRELINMEFPSVVMENEFLKAEFVPALGGRLWSLFDKKQNRDIIYKNPVFRPANLAVRDAWFSGGIEWNIGRLGHAAHTCSPVFAGILEEDGLTILRLWEFERRSGLFWRIDFSLPENSFALFAYVRIENPEGKEKPLYWWTNTAVPQTKYARVLSACDKVIYTDPKMKYMNYGSLSELPVLSGSDASYPALLDHSNEYFFQNDICCDENSFPWEAVVHENGYTFGEVSTPPLIYRKMFCWGNGRGNRRWQDFLSLPGEEYLEVQAGLSPTQLHTTDIAAGGIVDWVQAFTAFEAEPEKAHQKDFRAACSYISCQIKMVIGRSELDTALERGRRLAVKEAEILGMGSGWGAVERLLHKRSCPQGLSFPEESIGEAEAPWVTLLRTRKLPSRQIWEGPGSFVIDEAWEKYLIPSCEKDWLGPYHAGVIYFEHGDSEKAIAAWKESINRIENPWAYRNLAQAALRCGDTQGALDYYYRAFTLPGSEDQSFAEEYIPLLLAAGKEDKARDELDAFILRPGSGKGSVEAFTTPLLETAARYALNCGNSILLDKIFSVEPSHIRENNTTLVDIWVEREILRLCERGMSRTEAEVQVRTALTEGLLVPPREIDFRMHI